MTNVLSSSSDIVRNLGNLNVVCAVIKGHLLLRYLKVAEDAANRSDFRIVQRMTKELACAREASDGFMRDVNYRLLFHVGEQSKSWMGHFTTVPNYIISSGMKPIVDEMASRRNLQIRTALPSRTEIISAINAFKWCNAVGLDGLPVELFTAAPAVSAALLLLLVREC